MNEDGESPSPIDGPSVDWPLRTKNNVRSGLRALERVTLKLERPVDRAVGSPRLNPLYHTGTISIFLFGIVLLSVTLWTRDTMGTAEGAAGDLNQLLSHPVAGPLLEDSVALSNAPTLYAWIWERPAVWAPLPSDLAGVRDLVPGSIGLFPCATGYGDSLGETMIRAYRAQGGQTTSPGCPALVVWTDTTAGEEGSERP